MGTGFADWMSCCAGGNGEQLGAIIMSRRGKQTLSSPIGVDEKNPCPMKRENRSEKTMVKGESNNEL